MVNVVGSAHGQSAITCSGLNVNFSEGRLIEKLPIGDAVERHAPGKAHCFLMCFLPQRIQQADVRLFQGDLKRGSDIFVLFCHRLSLGSGVAKPLFEVRREEPAQHRSLSTVLPGHLWSRSVVAKVLEPQGKPAGRDVTAEEHPNQIVIPPAAAQTADPLDRDFHDRACVV